MTTRARYAVLAVILATALAGCDHAAPRPRSEAPVPSATVSTAPTGPEPIAFHLRFRPTAYAGWLDGIPDSVSVDVGLLSPGRERIRKAFCGREAFAFAEPPVVASRRATSPGDARDLRLFTDDEAAHRFLQKSLTVVAGCPADHRLRTSGRDDESATVREGQARWDLTRIGNAVLITSGVSDHRAAIVRSMCVFTPRGCPVTGADVPDRFPLARGLPDPALAEGPGAGLAGPSRALPAPTWTLCGHTLSLPEHRDRTTARWSNPEDYRGRELVTFDDSRTASAFVAGLSSFYRSCPEQPTGIDFIAYQHVEPRALGEESVALFRVQEFQGAPGIGVEISQVTRVGRSVLVDTVSNEGDARSVPTQLRRMTRASARVVRAMCVYAEAGCPAAAGALTLGPDGVGPLEIGMRASELRSLGIRLVPMRNGTGCSAFRTTLTGHEVGGDYEPRLGVSMLTGDGLVTPERVGPGTPMWRADAAYADGDASDGQLFVPGTPGRPGRSYRMEVVRGRVDSLMLLADDQRCAS